MERRYTINVELTEEEFKLLEEVQVITSERLKSKAIVRALKTFRRLRSPVERQRRRDKRRAIAPKAVKDRAITSAVEPTRYIPSETKDLVTIADGHRCSFVRDGQRCEETTGLQVDHVKTVFDWWGSWSGQSSAAVWGA